MEALFPEPPEDALPEEPPRRDWFRLPERLLEEELGAGWDWFVDGVEEDWFVFWEEVLPPRRPPVFLVVLPEKR